jgi:hypothetical protein
MGVHDGAEFRGIQLRSGIQLLLAAFRYAVDANANVAEFAVEIRRLHDLGMIESEFRWLLAKGYVKHFIDLTLDGDSGRSLRETGAGRFSSNSCFALTSIGAVYSQDIIECNGAREVEVQEKGSFGVIQASETLPHWDPDRQELTYHRHIVKRFKLPSCNQVAILAAFEEEGWPSRILDPLSPRGEQDPKRRLQDTIKGLNRAQRIQLIRFEGDGKGEGVLWSLRAENLPRGNPPMGTIADANRSAVRTRTT